MAVKRPAFTRIHEEKKADTFTVRLNDTERQLLDRSKAIFDVTSDSKMLKILALEIGQNVLFTTFKPELLAYLMRSDRKRLSDYFTDKEMLDKFVIQKEDGL